MRFTTSNLVKVALLAFVSAKACSAQPMTVDAQREILTPPAAPAPRINSPQVFGVRPGSPFLYSIPATGAQPIEYSADGLPAGLKLNTATGRITGLLAEAGEHLVTLHAKNTSGSAEKTFRIVA
ncbi:MAG: Ig domain-containing protein, partial [Opitutaceae bacterium]